MVAPGQKLQYQTARKWYWREMARSRLARSLRWDSSCLWALHKPEHQEIGREPKFQKAVKSAAPCAAQVWTPIEIQHQRCGIP